MELHHQEGQEQCSCQQHLTTLDGRHAMPTAIIQKQGFAIIQKQGFRSDNNQSLPDDIRIETVYSMFEELRHSSHRLP